MVDIAPDNTTKSEHAHLLLDPAFNAARIAFDRAISIGLTGSEAFSIATEVYTAAKRKIATK